MISRSFGTLVHPSCFRTSYGIGDFGVEAYKFVDFLKKSGQKFWQILPIEPLDKEHSPYKSISAFAGNPLLISIDLLVEDGLIMREDLEINESLNTEKVDFKKINKVKDKYLHIAYENFKSNNTSKEKFNRFCKKEYWLSDYSLYVALQKYLKEDSWIKWEDSLVKRNADTIAYYKELLSEEIRFEKFVQYIFFKQWFDLKNYANAMGIKIIGDLSMYVSYESCDVWVNKRLFNLDINNKPFEVSGFPPDPFFGEQQVWGHPIYDWDQIKKENFRWWLDRVENMLMKVDVIRFDHFRGFESFWVIPVIKGEKRKGYWRKGPAYSLFDAILEKFGNIPIIVEDIGYITDEVLKLKEHYSFIGMKILQYGLEYDSKSNENIASTVTYLGTHDNDPIVGWYNSLSSDEKLEVNKYLDININRDEKISWKFIRYAMSCLSDIVIIPVQDILGLGSEARMNRPGTLKDNWTWTFEVDELDDEIIYKINELAHVYKRVD